MKHFNLKYYNKITFQVYLYLNININCPSIFLICIEKIKLIVIISIKKNTYAFLKVNLEFKIKSFRSTYLNTRILRF